MAGSEDQESLHVGGRDEIAVELDAFGARSGKRAGHCILERTSDEFGSHERCHSLRESITDGLVI